MWQSIQQFVDISLKTNKRMNLMLALNRVRDHHCYIRILPLGTIDVCVKCTGNPSDISVSTKVVKLPKKMTDIP